MNFTTDLPKNNPICTYLVATGKINDECYRMHVVVNAQEYNNQYRNSDVLKELKNNQNRAMRRLDNSNDDNYDFDEKTKLKL
jgi:hypothetical protein